MNKAEAYQKLYDFVGSTDLDIIDSAYGDGKRTVMGKEKEGDLTFWKNPRPAAAITYDE